MALPTHCQVYQGATSDDVNGVEEPYLLWYVTHIHCEKICVGYSECELIRSEELACIHRTD